MKSFKKEKGKVVSRMVLAPDMKLIIHRKTDSVLLNMFIDGVERAKENLNNTSLSNPLLKR